MSNNDNQLNIPLISRGNGQVQDAYLPEVGVNLTNGYNGHLTSREASDPGTRWSKRCAPHERQNLRERTGLPWEPNSANNDYPSTTGEQSGTGFHFAVESSFLLHNGLKYRIIK